MSDETEKKDTEVLNSYTDFANNLALPGLGSQTSQADGLWLNNRWYLVSNYRQLLSELYTEHGIIQTLVDQPVDDAFRSGFTIKTGQLSPEEIEKLEHYLDVNNIIEEVKYACKWARLYGGGAVIPITDQDPAKPLNMDRIGPDTPLAFKAVDLWELYHTYLYGVSDTQSLQHNLDDLTFEHYDYYGQKVHVSRVFRIDGKRPPAFIRPRLRGWGMSECEKIVRSLNQYLKNQNVIYELLDEAKVDVYKINGLNSSLAHRNGTQAITTRVQTANMIKSYLSALTMDAQDDYEQKQIAFTGLSEVLVQVRQGIAADLKMPMTKVFGISAAGFNSGEDDIENYNAMLESEIRAKSKKIVLDVLHVSCQKLFGMVPEDLSIKFNPLRILSAVDEEAVNDAKFNRINLAYQSGLATAQEAKQSINKAALLPIEIDEESDGLAPLNNMFPEDQGGEE